MEVGTELKCNNVKPLKGNDVAPPLKKGDKYKALAVVKCSCGKEHIDVGLKAMYNYVRCYDCGEKLPNATHLCHPSRFDVVSVPKKGKFSKEKIVEKASQFLFRAIVTETHQCVSALYPSSSLAKPITLYRGQVLEVIEVDGDVIHATLVGIKAQPNVVVCGKYASAITVDGLNPDFSKVLADVGRERIAFNVWKDKLNNLRK